jgi:hypothetical protein
LIITYCIHVSNDHTEPQRHRYMSKKDCTTQGIKNKTKQQQQKNPKAQNLQEDVMVAKTSISCMASPNTRDSTGPAGFIPVVGPVSPVGPRPLEMSHAVPVLIPRCIRLPVLKYVSSGSYFPMHLLSSLKQVLSLLASWLDFCSCEIHYGVGNSTC